MSIVGVYLEQSKTNKTRLPLYQHLKEEAEKLRQEVNWDGRPPKSFKKWQYVKDTLEEDDCTYISREYDETIRYCTYTTEEEIAEDYEEADDTDENNENNKKDDKSAEAAAKDGKEVDVNCTVSKKRKSMHDD